MIDTFNADHLIEEDDFGNIEYKLKLVDPSLERIQHLTSQMKFRLEEGSGEAFYNVGYEDNGNPLGLCKEDLFKSVRNYLFIQLIINLIYSN